LCSKLYIASVSNGLIKRETKGSVIMSDPNEMMTMTISMLLINEDTGAGARDIHEEYKVKLSQGREVQAALMQLLAERLGSKVETGGKSKKGRR